MWDTLMSLFGQKPKIKSPLPDYQSLSDPQTAYMVKRNQLLEEEAAQPQPKFQARTLEYPEWMAAPRNDTAPLPERDYKPNITIPYSQGGNKTLDPGLAQILLNSFNDIGQATNSAKVLNHPKSQTYTPEEIKFHGHESWNYGENASFKTKNITYSNEGWDTGLPSKIADGDVKGKDGLYHSTDRGLFRINSRTFNGIMEDKHWGKLAREKFGINSWDDMEDPQKNAYMAKLIYERQGYGSWYAAPLDLRQQGRPDLAELSKLLANSTP